MRVLTVRNISLTQVGVCGKTVQPGKTIQLPLALVQGSKSYNDYTVSGLRGYGTQLSKLVQAGKIVVSLDGDVLTVDQVASLEAPISADLIKEDWQDSVLTRTNTPPATPAMGARYIVTAVATGAWTGKETCIAQWNGVHWDFTTPTKGTTVLVEDINTFYYFDGVAWGGWGASITHASLSGVTADQHHAQAHGITSADHTAAGLTTGHVLQATGAAAFAFQQAQHADLGGVSADQHHSQSHVLDGADHTVAGLTLGDVLMATGAATFAFSTLGAQFKRETATFKVPGVVSAGTEQGGVWYAPAAGSIVAVYAYRKSTTEPATGTTIDIHVAGTTIFTTQANRPYITFNDADGMVKATVIEAPTFVADDKVTMDVDSVDVGGNPSDVTVEIVVEYSA